ncbi:hypothetical protein M5K25_023402 [Dendrobium thyrsiflorum]|uniref:AB hydrolase-1 domain-containing protein n=1 Tax=Dendrobium thyrsiflorum TaxID=117978 RepID=A0ABD0U7W5_DENTH
METSKNLHLLLQYIRRFISRLLSLVSLKDFVLSLLLLLCGLSSLTVKLSGGTTSIHLWGPRRRRHSRPALVLLHGFGGFAKWQFERQIAPLSRHFDLYLPDLVFFGQSVSAEGKRSVKFQAECVAEAMRKLGVEKYTVAGVSYGGFVAFCMAAAAAEREVERVVVIASGVAATAKERKELAEKEGREVAELLLPERVEDLRNLFRRCMLRPPTWLPDFLLRDFIEIMFKDHRKERTELLNELLSNGVGWGALPIPKQETLILWGDEDTIFPLPLAYALKRHLGDKAKLQVIKEAGHALPLEKPYHVNSLIRRFILQEKVV